MSKFFDMDSPVMRFLSRMADLIILNILVLVTIIPVITIGASLSAMHYVLIKMVRNEENYIIKMYFKAFKDNFKKATLLWLIQLVIIAVFAGDYYIMLNSGLEFPKALIIAVFAVAIIFFMTAMYIFPLQARFENTIGQTIKNAFAFMILNFPKSIAMALIYAIPVVLLFLSSNAAPFLIMFGFSAPGLAAAYLYRKIFKKFEPEEAGPVGDMEFEVGGAEDTQEQVEADSELAQDVREQIEEVSAETEGNSESTDTDASQD